jgi:hypothetical protein
MVISGAPIFFSQIDGVFMNSVIMQLENEHNGEDTGKSAVKFVEQKIISHDVHSINFDFDCGVPNSFIEHSRRYVDPFHPLVPTPPPNFC